MKRQFLAYAILLLFMPSLANAQGNNAPKKNKVGVFFMKPDSKNLADFEQNLARHIKEFHTGRNAVDIYEGLVGERTGQFFMAYRQPSTWAEIEANNDVRQKDHSTDWDKNVSVFLSKEGPFQIYEYSTENSYTPTNMAEMPATEKWGLYFIELNMGMEEDFLAAQKKIKEMYQKNNSKEYFDFFTRVFGSGTQVAINIPLSKGWESFEPNPNSAWDKMFKNAFPKEDYKAWLKKLNSTIKSFESTVILLRKDLSSAGN